MYFKLFPAFLKDDSLHVVALTCDTVAMLVVMTSFGCFGIDPGDTMLPAR